MFKESSATGLQPEIVSRREPEDGRSQMPFEFGEARNAISARRLEHQFWCVLGELRVSRPADKGSRFRGWPFRTIRAKVPLNSSGSKSRGASETPTKTTEVARSNQAWHTLASQAPISSWQGSAKNVARGSLPEHLLNWPLAETMLDLQSISSSQKDHQKLPKGGAGTYCLCSNLSLKEALASSQPAH